MRPTTTAGFRQFFQESVTPRFQQARHWVPAVQNVLLGALLSLSLVVPDDGSHVYVNRVVFVRE